MRARTWLWVLFSVVGVTVGLTQSRATWLPWIAQNLIIEDRLRPAEMIAVFAGDDERARHAARLYRDGLGAGIVVTGELPVKGTELSCEKRITGAELNAKLLADAGLPGEAVIVIPRGTSTYEEGQAVKEFMLSRGYSSVTAVSSPYHMRRVRATLSRLLRGTRISVQYSPAPETDSRPSEWWRREKDLIQVTNEYIKLAYYHLALF